MRSLRLMALLMMLGAIFIPPRTQAAEVDYGLEADVYLWYASLDMAQYQQRLAKDVGLVDLAEYAGAEIRGGAHHIMSITPIAQSQDGSEVEVEIEFLLASAMEIKAHSEVRGQYVVQRLNLDNLGLVRSSVTLVNEYDDFTSRYRAAAPNNQIRAALYAWTQSLDSLDGARLFSLMATDASFSGPEDPSQTLGQYLAYLKRLEHSDSRRVIKNLTLTPETAGIYRLNFEYQWTATNNQGEVELAQVGVVMLLSVSQQGVKVHLYRAQYLPPVTDLGAEVRC
ncbi:hypothetical protein [Shewanella sp.]|uniref:hypothetical protein n=1 Tax=Shewanella sp. TaxID=50422 RepID=UPI003D0C5A96